MRPSWLTPSEEFRLHGALCVETQEHLLDYQITGAVVDLIQEQLTGIFECLPEDNAEWWDRLWECRSTHPAKTGYSASVACF